MLVFSSIIIEIAFMIQKTMTDFSRSKSYNLTCVYCFYDMLLSPPHFGYKSVVWITRYNCNLGVFLDQSYDLEYTTTLYPQRRTE